MDGQTFDRLTRSLATGMSRRRALKGLMGGALGGIVGARHLSQSSAGILECESHEDCGVCGLCNEGMCQEACSQGQQCCDTGCAECCTSGDCPEGEVCESGVCTPQVECTTDEQCDVCETCIEGQCLGACSQAEYCCDTGCAACCTDEHCGPCAVCANGQCYGLCSQGEQCVDDQCVSICGEFDDPCSSEGEPCCEGLICSAGTCKECDQAQGCPNGEYCENGACVPICKEAGETCGVLVSAAGDDSEQLDCCDGLVCCQIPGGQICAECCGDGDCPSGTICCAGACRELECCIDDPNPNDRCPEGSTCFEGQCEFHCKHDHECGHGKCCCPDGTCSKHCCEKDFCKHDHDCGHGKCCCGNGKCSHHCCKKDHCKHDHDCPHGTCCCGNGKCSKDCCKRHPKPDKPKQPPQVTTLPSTGVAEDAERSGWFGTAAVGAAAALLAGKRLRDGGSKPAESEE